MSDSEIISYEPATGEEFWRGRVSDIGDVVTRSRRAWPAWAAQPLSTRMELLRRFANEVRKEAEKLAECIARETGKPMWEARAEVEGVVARVEVSILAYAERTAQRKLDSAMQGTSALRHKPHGVVAVLGPFNMPAQVPAGHIVPALIAGNAIVFKPSEKAPATGEMLANCFHKAGIPAALVQVAIGGPEAGMALASHDGVDGVLFTGSAHAGIAINRKLAIRPDKIVALEMGGNNPIVVWDTPKITDAAVLVVQSAFSSAGQRCTAARRLIVKSSLYDAIVGEVKSLTDRIITGAPFDEPVPFMGPVIDNQVADGLTESFLYMLSHGGRAIKHLVRTRDDLPFVSPAIIDTTGMAERPDVELFGPILQVIRVDDLDQAIAEANNTRFGLCAAMIGGSPQEYNRFWANTRAGIVNWNRPTIGEPPSAPAGGVGLSGNHRPSGFYAADYCAYPVTSVEMEQPRAVIGAGFRETQLRETASAAVGDNIDPAYTVVLTADPDGEGGLGLAAAQHLHFARLVTLGSIAGCFGAGVIEVGDVVGFHRGEETRDAQAATVPVGARRFDQMPARINRHVGRQAGRPAEFILGLAAAIAARPLDRAGQLGGGHRLAQLRIALARRRRRGFELAAGSLFRIRLGPGDRLGRGFGGRQFDHRRPAAGNRGGRVVLAEQLGIGHHRA